MFLASFLLFSVIRQPIDFAFFGCNRVSDDAEKAQLAVNPSSANAPELKATLRDAAACSLVFALGDLVNGYGDDQGEKLKFQLDAWPALLPPGLKVVPVPGNHELNRKHAKQKLANPATDAVWVDWLGRNHFDGFAGNGPTPASGPEDKLATDQSKLNYSFTLGTTHFVVVNTDTRTTETEPGSSETKVGWVPANWIAKDLATAEADPAILDVFVMGHRNLVDPVSAKEDAPIDRHCAAEVVSAISRSPKVRAYLCAHVHAYDLQKIAGSNAYQIVVGNGGSDLAAEWKPADGRWFGFGEIKVHADGTIGLVLHKRPEPASPAAMDADLPPSTISPEIILKEADKSSF